MGPKMIHNVNIIFETIDDTPATLWTMIDRVFMKKEFEVIETLDGPNVALTIIVKEQFNG